MSFLFVIKVLPKEGRRGEGNRLFTSSASVALLSLPLFSSAWEVVLKSTTCQTPQQSTFG